MSSVRAVDVAPPERTERIRPLPTEEIRRPRATDPGVPLWAHRLEGALEAVARFGFAPTPSILLISATAIGAAFRHG